MLLTLYTVSKHAKHYEYILSYFTVFHAFLRRETKVQILSVEFAVDLGSCLRCGKATVSYLSSVTDAFRLKMYWAENQLMFCACEIQLFPVVLYVVKALPKSDFRLGITKHYVTYRESCFDGTFSICLSTTVVAIVHGRYPCYVGQLQSLE